MFTPSMETLVRIHRNRGQGQRLGQFFLNHYQPKAHNPELFHESNYDVAKLKIQEILNNLQYTEHLPEPVNLLASTQSNKL